MSNKKFKIAFFILLFVFACVVYFFLFLPDDFIIFPNSQITVKAYSDCDQQGNSEIVQEKSGPDFYFLSFILKKKYLYPYVTLSFCPKSKLDLSRYDTIKCDLETTNIKKIRLAVKYFDPELTRKEKPLSYVYMIAEWLVSNEQQEYTISYNDLSIHEWWFEENNIQESMTVTKKFSHVTGFEITTAYDSELNSKGSILISKLSCIRSRRGIVSDIIIMAGLYCLILCLVYAYMLLKFPKKGPASIKAFRQVEMQSEDRESKTLITYLANNFSKPDLTVRYLAKVCGIPAYKIPKIIRERYNVSFRQYLNLIRLTEAKRLLKETGLKTTEISKKVGYSSYEHFNRFFRKMENISPARFRKK